MGFVEKSIKVCFRGVLKSSENNNERWEENEKRRKKRMSTTQHITSAIHTGVATSTINPSLLRIRPKRWYCFFLRMSCWERQR